MVGPINDGTVQKTVDKFNASSYVGSEKTTTHEVVAWKTISFRNIWLMTSVHVRVPVAFPDLWLHRAVSKKECSQVPVVSEKVGANLASTFMPFFCRGPVSAENFASLHVVDFSTHVTANGAAKQGSLQSWCVFLCLGDLLVLVQKKLYFKRLRHLGKHAAECATAASAPGTKPSRLVLKNLA